MEFRYINDRKARIVHIITSDNAIIEHTIKSMEHNGFILLNPVRTQLQFIVFGKREYVMTFDFNPSKQVLERWMNEALQKEEYELAAVYRNKLKGL